MYKIEKSFPPLTLIIVITEVNIKISKSCENNIDAVKVFVKPFIILKMNIELSSMKRNKMKNMKMC